MIDFNFPIVILSSPPDFSGVRVTRSLVLNVCFVDRCLSFCIFSFWPLCCLFFFDIRILITPLVSSNSSYHSRISHKNNRSSSSSLSSSSSFFIVVVIIIITILITNAAFSFIINQILIIFFYNLLIDFVINKQMNSD